MKLFKLAAITSALTLALTGCSGVPGLIPEEPVSMIGLTGADLTSVAKFDDMNVDDKLMFWSCRQLHAYQTDESIDDSGEVSTLNPGEGKSFMRGMGLDQLNMLVGDYPEVQIYIDGVTQELADEESSDPGFDSFVKVCKTYSEVQKNVELHYVAPIKLNSNCWDGKNIKVTVQEKVGEEWVNTYSKKGLVKSDHCESDYPWGFSYILSRSDLDEDRIFRMVLVSTVGNTLSGKKKWVTEEQTLTTSVTEDLSFY